MATHIGLYHKRINTIGGDGLFLCRLHIDKQLNVWYFLSAVLPNMQQWTLSGKPDKTRLTVSGVADTISVYEVATSSPVEIYIASAIKCQGFIQYVKICKHEN